MSKIELPSCSKCGSTAYKFSEDGTPYCCASCGLNAAIPEKLIKQCQATVALAKEEHVAKGVPECPKCGQHRWNYDLYMEGQPEITYCANCGRNWVGNTEVTVYEVIAGQLGMTVDEVKALRAKGRGPIPVNVPENAIGVLNDETIDLPEVNKKEVDVDEEVTEEEQAAIDAKADELKEEERAKAEAVEKIKEAEAKEAKDKADLEARKKSELAEAKKKKAAELKDNEKKRNAKKGNKKSKKK